MLRPPPGINGRGTESSDPETATGCLWVPHRLPNARAAPTPGRDRAQYTDAPRAHRKGMTGENNSSQDNTTNSERISATLVNGVALFVWDSCSARCRATSSTSRECAATKGFDPCPRQTTHGRPVFLHMLSYHALAITGTERTARIGRGVSYDSVRGARGQLTNKRSVPLPGQRVCDACRFFLLAAALCFHQVPV